MRLHKSQVRDKRAVLTNSPVGYTACEMRSKHPYRLVSTVVKTLVHANPYFSSGPCKKSVQVCVFGQGLSFKAPAESPPLGPVLISFELGAAILVEDRIASRLGLRGIAGSCTTAWHRPIIL